MSVLGKLGKIQIEPVRIKYLLYKFGLKIKKKIWGVGGVPLSKKIAWNHHRTNRYILSEK